jgi:hypothetical protein
VAARLAAKGHIAPLASRGIVGQVTRATIVYDAETTHGGSGGPVLDIDGSVVAVNAAILPEYGGSNPGVPVAKVRALLEDAGFRYNPNLGLTIANMKIITLANSVCRRKVQVLLSSLHSICPIGADDAHATDLDTIAHFAAATPTLLFGSGATGLG